jgi:subtilisin
MSWANRSFGRQGFHRVFRGATLLELLIVMTIIGTVMALVLVAAWPLLNPEKGLPELPNAVLVDEQELALAGFTDKPLQVPAAPAIFGGRDTHIPDQYLIRFAPWVTDQAAEAGKLAGAYAGGKVLHVYDHPVVNGCNVYIPGVTTDQLKTHASVASVEADGRCYLSAETTPTGVKRISFSGASSQRTYDPAAVGLSPVQGTLVLTATNKVVIAVMDTGIDGSHPDLYVTNSVGFGYPNGTDQNGHGTHVAGTIGAKQNNQGVIGVFPGAPLWSLRVLGASGSGSYGDVANALQYVIANANQISACNMSFGGGKSQMINDLVDKCVDAGVVMVAAAGNSTDDADKYTPSSAPKALTVSALADSDGKYGGTGASTSYGNDDTFATFSNYGTRVDVIAPGVNILSTLPKKKYGSLSGTSMAAPHIAGLMGLYRDSTVSTPTGNRKALPLEVLALLVQNIGAEVVPGRYDSRTYPLLVGATTSSPSPTPDPGSDPSPSPRR